MLIYCILYYTQIRLSRMANQHIGMNMKKFTKQFFVQIPKRKNLQCKYLKMCARKRHASDF